MISGLEVYGHRIWAFFRMPLVINQRDYPISEIMMLYKQLHFINFAMCEL